MRKLFIILIFILAIFGCQEMGNGGGGSSSGFGGENFGDKIYKIRGSYSPIAFLDSELPIVYATYDLNDTSAVIVTDANNRIISLTLNHLNGDDEVFYYEYDGETNNIVKRQYFYVGDPILRSEKTYTYDVFGRLEKRIYDDVLDGNYDLYEYYGETNSVKKIIRFKFGVEDTYVDYEYYDGTNNIKTLIYHRPKNVSWYKIDYEYDGLNVTIKYWDYNYGEETHNEWVGFRTYSSEEPDFLLSEMHYDCDENYNPIGNPNYTVFFQFYKTEGDGSNNDWFERLLNREEDPYGWY